MKTQLTREFYLRDGYLERVSDGNLYAVYTNIEQPHNPKAMFFAGKQSKPLWHYRFTTIEDMNKKIDESISNIKANEEYKAKEKEERKAKYANLDTSSIKVGDIYHWSGGYNCTKNAYIKVVEIISKKKFACAELGKTQVSGDWMNGEVAPVIDAMGEVQIYTARPGYSGQVILRNTKNAYHDNYYKWDGKPDWENCD